MFVHGLRSSGLFCLSNIVYERLGSHRLIINREVDISNKAASPSLNLLAEISLINRDDLGLVSYYLVIYYQNVKSYNAGMMKALSSRFGDVALLLLIARMIRYGRWNYL
ncbi:NADH-ubiquinone oxidoreductase chain 5 [Gryllus bimaculatus]|nr:NADH-ubiquinone oxidoreductase chain 5 [Gryllus bimaculatus]